MMKMSGEAHTGRPAGYERTAALRMVTMFSGLERSNN